MVYKVLRFLGAIIMALIFDYLLSVSHIAFFGGTAHFFSNLSWSNLLSFDIFRGFLLPIVWGVLSLIGIGLVWIVRGEKLIAAIPIYIFVTGAVTNFKLLFLEPVELIVNDIGLGGWYYFGAGLTFFIILALYISYSVLMLLKQGFDLLLG